jgi:hypothetical protein
MRRQGSTIHALMLGYAPFYVPNDELDTHFHEIYDQLLAEYEYEGRI